MPRPNVRQVPQHAVERDLASILDQSCVCVRSFVVQLQVEVSLQ